MTPPQVEPQVGEVRKPTHWKFPLVVIHSNHHVEAFETTPYLAADEAQLLSALKAVANDEKDFDEAAAALVPQATTPREALRSMGCKARSHGLFSDAFFDGWIGIMPLVQPQPQGDFPQ